MRFSHLHCHTQFSLLDGAASIKGLVKKAKSLDMPALAITDHGNMFGVPSFVKEAQDAGIKPIIGSEFYLTPVTMELGGKSASLISAMGILRNVLSQSRFPS